MARRNNFGLFLRMVIIVTSFALYLGSSEAVPCPGDRLSKNMHEETWKKPDQRKKECLTQDWVDVSLDFLNINRGLPQCYPQDQRGEFLVFVWILICMIILIIFIAYLRCAEMLKDNLMGFSFPPPDGQLN